MISESLKINTTLTELNLERDYSIMNMIEVILKKNKWKQR